MVREARLERLQRRIDRGQLRRRRGPKSDYLYPLDELLVEAGPDGSMPDVPGWRATTRRDLRGATVVRLRREQRRAGTGDADELASYLRERGFRTRYNPVTLGPPNDLYGQPHYHGEDPVPFTPKQEVGPLQAAAAPPLVTVAVLDTGVAHGNTWLQGHYVSDRHDDEDVADMDPQDDVRDIAAGHGTFVAGIIASRAPRVQVRVERLLDSEGYTTTWDVSEAIRDLEPADILNLSLGGPTPDDQPPADLAEAIAEWRAAQPGRVVVAAAGNVEEPRVFWPAALPDVVAVGAVDDTGQPASFSNTGVNPIDAWAPGVDVMGAFIEFPPFESWATWSGTSFATPAVAGAIARRLHDLREAGDRATAQDAWDALRSEYPHPELGVLIP